MTGLECDAVFIFLFLIPWVYFGFYCLTGPSRAARRDPLAFLDDSPAHTHVRVLEQSPAPFDWEVDL